jgi:hypothetical protein
MQRKKFMLISALLLTAWLSGVCQAAIVVDTGPGPSSGDSWFLSSIHRGMAGKFTTSQAWMIASVEAWMQINAAGPANAIIYNNDGDGTVPGTKRFSQVVDLATNPVAAWRGATGLKWSLPAGTYWVGFEVDTPGIDGVVYYPAPSPLVAYAADIFEQPWFSASGLDLGFRIQAITSSLAGIDLLLMD